MATRLNPYINFNGDAREAMEFYRGVFGGELVLTTFGDIGDTSAIADRIMHGQLETPDGMTLMGADLMPGMPFDRGTAMTVSLSGDDAEALRGWWAKLCEGGQVATPLETQVWGDEFGQCADRFGVSWLVNISGTTA